jgi:capsule polysaccharide modification protein KpsS
MKSEVYKREVDTRDEMLARIFDAAARINKREDQFRQTTRDLCTRAALRLTVGFSNSYSEL